MCLNYYTIEKIQISCYRRKYNLNDVAETLSFLRYDKWVKSIDTGNRIKRIRAPLNFIGGSMNFIHGPLIFISVHRYLECQGASIKLLIHL